MIVIGPTSIWNRPRRGHISYFTAPEFLPLAKPITKLVMVSRWGTCITRMERGEKTLLEEHRSAIHCLVGVFSGGKRCFRKVTGSDDSVKNESGELVNNGTWPGCGSSKSNKKGLAAVFHYLPVPFPHLHRRRNRKSWDSDTRISACISPVSCASCTDGAPQVSIYVYNLCL